MKINPDRRKPGVDLPEKLRLFIFQYIDSVEMIQVLIYLKSQADQWPSVDQINRELRSNRVSILGKLEMLKEIGIVDENPMDPGHFQFSPKNSELDQLVFQLLEEYRVSGIAREKRERRQILKNCGWNFCGERNLNPKSSTNLEPGELIGVFGH